MEAKGSERVDGPTDLASEVWLPGEEGNQVRGHVQEPTSCSIYGGAGKAIDKG